MAACSPDPENDKISSIDMASLFESLETGGIYHSNSPDLELKRKIPKKKHGHYLKRLEKRDPLPICQYKEQILEKIKGSQIVIIEGETGFGKSSQVPRWCLELPGVNQIVCTQSKKMEAINLAQRVSKEMGLKLGQKVGFVVQFESKISSKTALKYVTDGVLIRDAMQDRILSCYDVIIIDEVHERRLGSDTLLAIIRDILPLRSNLKVVLMCSYNINEFSKLFDVCWLLSLPKKLHPVKIVYESNPTLDIMKKSDAFRPYVYDAIDLILEICIDNDNVGDILVFVTCRDEIDFICKNVEEKIEANKGKGNIGEIDLIPFHASLPYTSLKRAFAPSPPSSPEKIGRKCIVATNLAETITINGVVFVIDAGVVKRSFYSSGHLDCLLNVNISKVITDQRAERAGKTRPGICYRLYSNDKFNQMMEDTVPEMHSCDLKNVMLRLKAMNISLDIFKSIGQPDPERVENAMDNLKLLGAIDAYGNITSVGKLMAKFPVDADIARMLVVSHYYQCQEEIISLAAILTVDKPSSVFVFKGYDHSKSVRAHSTLHHPSGDHLTFVNVYNAFLANNRTEEWCRKNYINFRVVSEGVKIREKLLEMMLELKLLKLPKAGSAPAAHENIMKAIITGFCGNIAQEDPLGRIIPFNRTKYITVRCGLKVRLHPTSVLSFDSCHQNFCYNSCLTHKDREIFINTVSLIEEEWYDDVRETQKAQHQALQIPALKKLKLETW